MPTVTNELIGRGQAVQQIADQLADRTSYVITTPAERLGPLVRALADHAPRWIAYLDNATGTVLRTPDASTVCAVDRVADTAAVITVPKAVAPAALAAALGQPVPDDGSQDIFVLCGHGEPVPFPLLFVDALDLVDPVAAAQLRADRVADDK
jgi:hypothetical protein